MLSSYFYVPEHTIVKMILKKIHKHFKIYSKLGCNLQNRHCVGDSIAITRTFPKLQHLQNTLRASLPEAWLPSAQADLTPG